MVCYPQFYYSPVLMSLPRLNSKFKKTTKNFQATPFKLTPHHRFKSVSVYKRQYGQRHNTQKKMVELLRKNHRLQLKKEGKSLEKGQKQHIRRQGTYSIKTEGNSIATTVKEVKNLEIVPRSHAESYYQNNLAAKDYSHSDFFCFMDLLRDQNPLFHKISPIIAEVLLKLGFIASYQPGQTVYKQASPINKFGIVLWGHLNLKKKMAHLQFLCQPGHAIGEELLFEDHKKSQNRVIRIEKGRFITFQKCKAALRSGVLFIGLNQYEWIREQLLRQGYKQAIHSFESLLQRTYLRKREQRMCSG